MSNQPKLKIRSILEPGSKVELCDLEQAGQHLVYSPGTAVLVEGHLIHSHEALVELVTSEQFRGRELLEVMLFPVIEGG